MLLMALPVVALFAQTPTSAKAESAVKSEVAVGPKADWKATTVDLGNVDFMVSKDAEFILTNNGNQPLLITSAKASCGCTNLRYSQEPVLPGKSTTIALLSMAAAMDRSENQSPCKPMLLRILQYFRLQEL